MKYMNILIVIGLFFLQSALVAAAEEARSESQSHSPSAIHHSQKSDVIYTCPMHPEIRKAEAGLCPICNMSLIPEAATDKDKADKDKADHSKHDHSMHETKPQAPAVDHSQHKNEMKKDSAKEKETIYTCSMHPQIRESKPGSCPICGMDLVPVKPQGALPESNVPGFATIKVNPTQQWLIGVKTAPVKRENLTRRLRTFGTVAYDPKLYVAQKEFLEVIKTGRASGSRSFIEASRRKLMLLGMTPKQIDALARKGVVDESLFLTEGTGKAWIYSVIYESERPLIREGLSVEARSVGHPQMKYEGKIDAIIPIVDPKNRTIRVRSAVADPINMLQPDMFMDVFIEIPLGKTLTVPKSAILQTGLRNIALVSKGDGIFEPHEVMLGNQSDEKIQIISGLEEGQTVVTSANFLLDSESQLRSAFNAALGGQQHDH